MDDFISNINNLIGDEPLVTPVPELVETLLIRPNMVEYRRICDHNRGCIPGTSIPIRNKIVESAIQMYGYPVEGRHWLTGHHCLGVPVVPTIGKDM